jgi:hypothetical protein
LIAQRLSKKGAAKGNSASSGSDPDKTEEMADKAILGQKVPMREEDGTLRGRAAPQIPKAPPSSSLEEPVRGQKLNLCNAYIQEN